MRKLFIIIFLHIFFLTISLDSAQAQYSSYDKNMLINADRSVDAYNNLYWYPDPTIISDGTVTWKKYSGINYVQTIDITSKSLSGFLDLHGMIHLENINSNNNQITGLNLDGNTALKTLYVSLNQLSALDISKYTALNTLYVGSNQLSVLDVSKNTSLKALSASYNQLTSMNLSNNKALEFLFLSGNPIKELDLSKNTALKYIDVQYNPLLTSLILPQGVALQTLYASNNQLAKVDVSKNTALRVFEIDGNQLKTFDVSKNKSMTQLNASGNQLTSLILANGGDMEFLNVNYNQLTTLDISKNTSLRNLYAEYNQLNTLNTSQNTSLMYLFLSDNLLKNLDVSKNLNLVHLEVQNNQISSLILPNSANLSHFSAVNNNLTTLNISKNRNLSYIDLSDNYLTTLDISQNTMLRDLIVSNNYLTKLDTSTNSSLERLSIVNNPITDLDLTKNTNLSILRMGGNFSFNTIKFPNFINTIDLETDSVFKLNSNTLMNSNLLFKEGMGTVILNNNSKLKHGAEIFSGGLVVGETPANYGVTLTGKVFVGFNFRGDENPWLGGHGKIIGDVEIGSDYYQGFLSPGYSIGSLTIDGDLTFSSNGFYDVEIDRFNQNISDRTVVTGTATLDGTVRHILTDGFFSDYINSTKEWLILDAQTLVGKFNNVISSYSFLIPQLRYDANAANVYLSFQSNLPPNSRNTLPASSDNKMVNLYFTFLKEGEINYEGNNETSVRNISLNEVNSILNAGTYWANMLSNYDTKRDNIYIDIYTFNKKNAAARPIRNYAKEQSNDFIMYAFLDNLNDTDLPDIFPNCIEFTTNCISHHASVKVGGASEDWTYDINRNQNIMPWNLESWIIHELGHVFGISAHTPDLVDEISKEGYGPKIFETLLQDRNTPLINKKYENLFQSFYNMNPSTRNFLSWVSDNPSEYIESTRHVYDTYNNVLINGSYYKMNSITIAIKGINEVSYENLITGEKESHNINSPYFPAELRPHDDPLYKPVTIISYNPAIFDDYFHGEKAMTVYGDGTPRRVPMMGVNDQPDQRYSHFGLRNTIMTHRGFRNYASFIEVELAALADLGLEVDYKNYFGKSVYVSGIFGEHNSIIDYNDYLLLNKNPYSIGIHLYADRVRFEQLGDITVNGEASAGIRSDGYLNTINIDSKSTISVTGARSTGLLVSYGHDTTVNLHGKIEAQNQDGIGAAFDIGVNFADGNYTEDGYGELAQFSHFKIRNRSWLADLFINFPEVISGYILQEYEDAEIILDGPLIKEFNIIGSLLGSKAAIYIGGNSHVDEINILGNVADIQGPIINDYYYESEGRSTKLTFGKSYDISADRETIVFDYISNPSFRFIIKDDILGYGARVENGYKGRYSGRGLFDVELHGGKTTLMYDAKIHVRGFTMESGATLLTTADFDNSLYPIIIAEDIYFKEGSFVGFDQSNSYGFKFLPSGSEYKVLELKTDNYTRPGFASFKNKSKGWSGTESITIKRGPTEVEGHTVAAGVFNYNAELFWKDDLRTLILKIVGEPTVNEETSGVQSSESASRMTTTTASYAQRSISKHIADVSPAYRRKYDSPPSSGENDQVWALWLAPWYSYDHHDSQYGSEGFSVKSYGLTLGLDHTFQDNSPLIGLALSVGRPEAKSRFVNTKGKAFAISGYFNSILPYQFDVSAILSYGFFNFDQTRLSSGVRYAADYDSQSLTATVELGRPFALNDAWILRPYGQVSYNHNEVDAYSESNHGPQAQSIAKNTTEQWRAELGANIIWNHSDRLTMVGRLGWSHNFDRKNEHVGYFVSDPNPSYFRIETTPLDKNNVVYGLSAIVSVNDSVDLKLTYDGGAGRNSVSHAGALTVVYNF